MDEPQKICPLDRRRQDECQKFVRRTDRRKDKTLFFRPQDGQTEVLVLPSPCQVGCRYDAARAEYMYFVYRVSYYLFAAHCV